MKEDKQTKVNNFLIKENNLDQYIDRDYFYFVHIPEGERLSYDLVLDSYQRAKELLSKHKEGHNQLAQILKTKEVIFAEDVEKIFGKRPWASRSEEIMNSEAEKPTLENNEEQSDVYKLENKEA